MFMAGDFFFRGRFQTRNEKRRVLSAAAMQSHAARSAPDWAPGIEDQIPRAADRMTSSRGTRLRSATRPEVRAAPGPGENARPTCCKRWRLTIPVVVRNARGASALRAPGRGADHRAVPATPES